LILWALSTTVFGLLHFQSARNDLAMRKEIANIQLTADKNWEALKRVDRKVERLDDFMPSPSQHDNSFYSAVGIFAPDSVAIDGSEENRQRNLDFITKKYDLRKLTKDLEPSGMIDVIGSHFRATE